MNSNDRLIEKLVKELDTTKQRLLNADNDISEDDIREHILAHRQNMRMHFKPILKVKKHPEIYCWPKI